MTLTPGTIRQSRFRVKHIVLMPVSWLTQQYYYFLCCPLSEHLSTCYAGDREICCSGTSSSSSSSAATLTMVQCTRLHSDAPELSACITRLDLDGTAGAGLRARTLQCNEYRWPGPVRTYPACQDCFLISHPSCTLSSNYGCPLQVLVIRISKPLQPFPSSHLQSRIRQQPDKGFSLQPFHSTLNPQLGSPAR